jgi:hypothetical protein
VTVPVGVFPGSFDPLTVAHVAIADAAHDAFGLDRLDLAMSTVALAKEHGHHHPLAERVAAIEAAAAAGGRPWLAARVTDDRLVADIAEGYDVCVVGADKWLQLFDVSFYGGSIAGRDAALARLPRLAVAPRAGVTLPADLGGGVLLDVDPAHAAVSSTAVREGRHDWRA